jgi:small-conductance mechanosensitive channel
METKYINQFYDILPSLLLSIFIFIIFYIIAEYYKDNIINKNKNKKKLINFVNQEIRLEQEITLEQDMNDYIDDNYDQNLIYYQLSWIIYYSIIIFGLIFSLINLGFNVATILTLLGTLGLALGLALQETIKNIISGIYISINQLFKLGDLISLKPIGNLNSTSGKIIDFNLYYTTILEPENNTISMIPNNIIQNNILTNLTLSKNFE